MAYISNGSFTSLYGRRLGLNKSTTSLNGGREEAEFLTGPDDFRQTVYAADSTGTNLLPYGVHNLPGTSAGSSVVYTIDPPIAGVRVVIAGTTTNGPFYVKTKNSETIVTTLGSTFTTVKISTLGGGFELLGLTTGQWLGLGLTSGTSSNASGFGLTTST